MIGRCIAKLSRDQSINLFTVLPYLPINTPFLAEACSLYLELLPPVSGSAPSSVKECFLPAWECSFMYL